MNLGWSVEFDFSEQGISKAPQKPGIYEILQSAEYPRYEGTTRILKIGCSHRADDLQSELKNHLKRHAAANRLRRICRRPNLQVTFQYSQTSDGAEARTKERELLMQFEDKHWDLPVLNAQRGYNREEDKKYRG